MNFLVMILLIRHPSHFLIAVVGLKPTTYKVRHKLHTSITP